MRHLIIDFNTSLIEAGYLGEHNATELVIVKPVDVIGAMYSVAFMTNGEVIHSKFFDADEDIRVPLWQQLTQDYELGVQLEAYDEQGDYLGKSAMITLLFGGSAHGTDVIADADNPDVYSEIALNTWFRETLEDNVDTLDKLSTSDEGKLLFDGKLIEGSSGGNNNGEVSSDLVEQIEANTENRHWHDNKNILDRIKNVQGYLSFDNYGISATSGGVFAFKGDIPVSLDENWVKNILLKPDIQGNVSESSYITTAGLRLVSEKIAAINEALTLKSKTFNIADGVGIVYANSTTTGDIDFLVDFDEVNDIDISKIIMVGLSVTYEGEEYSQVDFKMMSLIEPLDYSTIYAYPQASLAYSDYIVAQVMGNGELMGSMCASIMNNDGKLTAFTIYYWEVV